MKIAIIDDQKEIRYSISRVLKKWGYDIVEFSGLEEDIAEQLKKDIIDIFIIDIMLSDTVSGIDIIKKLKDTQTDYSIILMTAHTTPANMIDASKIGIKDILQKPFSPEQLKVIIQKYTTKNSNTITIMEQLDDEFIGSFETMREIYEKIGIASNNNLPALILGETGTGKELIANLIHKNSKNSNAQFIAVNCAAIPKDLFESQFFGYEKGAFTDASSTHLGYAQAVGDGTLFLDEIGELDIEMQSKLLRFLETKSFKRVGGNSDIAFQGRIISATNVDLQKSIAKENFRQDLYFRLSTITITVPTLQQRKEDIPKLVNFFINKANQDLKLHIQSITHDALEMLQQKNYSGNVRELKNIIYNSVLNARGEILLKENIVFQENSRLHNSSFEELIEKLIEEKGIENSKTVLDDLNKTFFRVLFKKESNITHLSQYLQTSRSTLRNILKQHKLIE